MRPLPAYSYIRLAFAVSVCAGSAVELNLFAGDSFDVARGGFEEAIAERSQRSGCCDLVADLGDVVVVRADLGSADSDQAVADIGDQACLGVGAPLVLADEHVHLPLVN